MRSVREPRHFRVIRYQSPTIGQRTLIPWTSRGDLDWRPMDNERIRELCLALPHVTETVNWGHHLVYWVGNRASGGRMFAMTDVDGTGTGVLWFHCGAERFHDLLEVEGIRPAPYLAKAHWVTVERWETMPAREYESELRKAHALIFAKLPPRARRALEVPGPENAKKRASRGSGRTSPASAKKGKKGRGERPLS